MRNIFLVVFLVFSLASCKSHNFSYNYLMRHPSVLQKQVLRCEVEVVDTTECKEVRRAANDFDLLAAERQTNPEQFGEKILREEEKLGEESESVRVLLAVVAITGIE